MKSKLVPIVLVSFVARMIAAPASLDSRRAVADFIRSRGAG